MATKKETKQTTDVSQHECFLVVKIEKTYKIVMGNSIISQKEFKTKEEAIKYINSKPYELIYNGAMFLTNQMKGENKQ